MAKEDSELTKNLQGATSTLLRDLQGIDVSNLNISEYNQHYLGEKLRTLDAELSRSAWILDKTFANCEKQLTDAIFIEYGGGTGFLALLAKRMGVGTVIYNDIYAVSVSDARAIAQALGCQADHYVQGNIDDLVAFCDKHSIKCDGMASYDVLEHIYDIDDFCSKLPALSHKGTSMVHASGANMFFYPSVKSLTKIQIKAEIQDKEKQWGHKDSDSLSSFLGERRKIIGRYANNLSSDEIEKLARETRGLILQDIIKVVDRYIEHNELPRLIEHSTNTCNPNTGNWAEHFINPYYLAETFTFNGFDARVFPLYWYGTGGSPVKKLARKLLNFGIRMNKAPLYFAPAYAIYARYAAPYPDTNPQHKYHIYKCHRSFLWWYFMTPLWELGSYALSGRLVEPHN